MSSHGQPAGAADVLARFVHRLWWRPQLPIWGGLLWPLESLYAALSGWQRSRQRRRQPTNRADLGLDCPIIVVGNLIAGGAGKTPTTIELVRLLRAQGWRPGIVSRGYGRQARSLCDVTTDTPASQCGDEPLLIHLRTAAPVCVLADRLAAARHLRAAHPEVNLILADDGLQHLRLPRDFEVIVFDGRGTGNGRLLPAGPLRQPMPPAPPAQALVIYNCDQPSTAWPGHLARRGLNGICDWPAWRSGAPASPQALQALRERSQQRPVLAAAGLAEPERFFRMLEALGLRITRLPLPDHANLHPPPWPSDTPEVIVTEKDAVKLSPAAAGGVRIWVAPLDFALPDAVSAQLAHWLAPWRHNTAAP